MPLLEQMHAKYKPLGFTLLGVNVEPDSSAAAENWLKDTPVTLSDPVRREERGQQARYDVEGMPSTVFVDRKGNVRYVHRGYKPGDEDEYAGPDPRLVKE